MGFGFCLIVAGCGAQPAPHMFGAERIDLRRGGRDYVVFKKANKVEVIRLGWASPGEHQAIRAEMIAIIPEVTGCKTKETSLQGDSGEMRALLSCPTS